MGGRKVQFRNHHYLADTTGTGWWRHIFPVATMDCVQDQIGMQNSYSRIVNTDPNFYVGMNSVWIQRWTGPQYRKVVEDFLLPVFKQTGTKLIYEIDDLTAAEHIPLYNHGRSGFEDPSIQADIKAMLHASDNVVVTTNKLKQMMATCYDLPMEKILAIPNLMPHWWIGDRYDPERRTQAFSQLKAKPRIGVISSMSHYNVDDRKDADGNFVKDDMDVLVDTIRETVDDFQWVIVSFAVHGKRADLVKAKKIEIHPTVPLLSYPTFINHLNLQAVVAPLQDNEFNHCKSIIKYEECAALGIPLYASKMLPYSEVMPEDQMFSTGAELKEQLMKLKFGSTGAYKKRIAAQFNWLNSPTTEGDAKINNWWMEDNLNVWTPLHTLPLKDNLVIDTTTNTEKENTDEKAEKQTQGMAGKGADAQC